MNEYSDDQLRDYAMRVSWQMLDDADKEQMLAFAKASLYVADHMESFWKVMNYNDTP